jgi:hypothetical protein
MFSHCFNSVVSIGRLKRDEPFCFVKICRAKRIYDFGFATLGNAILSGQQAENNRSRLVEIIVNIRAQR